MAKETTAEYLLKPFRVNHTNGDCVAGFDTLSDAEENAAGRNAKAKELGISGRYVAAPV